jgi:peroxiredoxin
LQQLNKLPKNLPIPVDDGACRHLLGQILPDIKLKSTNHESISLRKLSGWVVIYCYPKTGRPDTKLPENWDIIPGARGCTPQSCSYRDHYQTLTKLKATVFGLSTQSTEYQLEAVNRLHLPYPLLSDDEYQFTDSLTLPTFESEGILLNKRVTLIVHNGIIKHYFYPVFPPDKNADEVISWLSLNV